MTKKKTKGNFLYIVGLSCFPAVLECNIRYLLRRSGLCEETTPLRTIVSEGHRGRVQQFKSAARLVLLLGVREHVIQREGGGRDMRRCFSSSHSFCPQSVCPEGEL